MLTSSFPYALVRTLRDAFDLEKGYHEDTSTMESVSGVHLHTTHLISSERGHLDDIPELLPTMSFYLPARTPSLHYAIVRPLKMT